MMRLLFALCGLLMWSVSIAQSAELTPAEFKQKMEEDKDAVILDVRTAEEVESGVIGKPMIIDYFRKDFNARIKELDNSKTYLVYCATGFRSGETVRLMRKNGFKKAYNLAGGIQHWRKKNLPVQK